VGLNKIKDDEFLGSWRERRVAIYFTALPRKSWGQLSVTAVEDAPAARPANSSFGSVTVAMCVIVWMDTDESCVVVTGHLSAVSRCFRFVNCVRKVSCHGTMELESIT